MEATLSAARKSAFGLPANDQTPDVCGAHVVDASTNHVFEALAHPTRRAILARLVNGSASVVSLSSILGVTLPTLYKHLRVLKRAGLVIDGNRSRGSRVSMNLEAVSATTTWLAALADRPATATG